MPRKHARTVYQVIGADNYRQHHAHRDAPETLCGIPVNELLVTVDMTRSPVIDPCAQCADVELDITAEQNPPAP